jgi:AhpC/TSA family
MSADRLGAGTTFEVKCLFAIDSITAVYRANRESGKKAHSARVSGRYELIFSQGHWCPYCRININALVEAHNALPAGAEIVAIMPDRRKFVAELKQQSQLPFPLLTDADNGCAKSPNLDISGGRGNAEDDGGPPLGSSDLPGRQLLDAPDLRDVRRRSRWADQGTLYRSGLS